MISKEPSHGTYIWVTIPFIFWSTLNPDSEGARQSWEPIMQVLVKGLYSRSWLNTGPTPSIRVPGDSLRNIAVQNLGVSPGRLWVSQLKPCFTNLSLISGLMIMIINQQMVFDSTVWYVSLARCTNSCITCMSCNDTYPLFLYRNICQMNK